MVLRPRGRGRVGHCRHLFETGHPNGWPVFSCHSHAMLSLLGTRGGSGTAARSCSCANANAVCRRTSRRRRPRNVAPRHRRQRRGNRRATSAASLVMPSSSPKPPTSNERDMRNVERIALFHDIGKIDEALFDIIHDDSNLTPAEREAVATHPDRRRQRADAPRAFYPELSRRRALTPRAVGRHRISRGLRGRRDPARGAHRLDRRRVRRDDLRSPLSLGAERDRSRAKVDRTVAGRSSIRISSTCSSPRRYSTRSIGASCARITGRSLGEPTRRGKRERSVPELSFRWRTDNSRRRALSDREARKDRPDHRDARRSGP